VSGAKSGVGRAIRRDPEVREREDQPRNRELRQLIREASLSLARLDAERLEELAISCHALNHDLASSASNDWVELARQAREAAGDMAVFARVLEATRANLEVLNRLKELRGGTLEYGGGAGIHPGRHGQWAAMESGHGNH
jgi:hypothetical protein